MTDRMGLRLRCSKCGRKLIVDSETYLQGALYVCPDCEQKQAPEWIRVQPDDVLFAMRRRLMRELNGQLPGTFAYKRTFAAWAQVDAELSIRGMME